MTDEAFEQLVAEGYNSLPKWVTETIQNVALVVENEPSEELRKKEHLRNDETLLGYYTGVPLSERGDRRGCRSPTRLRPCCSARDAADASRRSRRRYIARRIFRQLL